MDREQKQAVGILSIGTFFEYFDVMLYVHMAAVLNDLFFPKTDPFTTTILSAFAFCSTYILRPFAGIIFGWIGDTVGRKYTIVITTVITAVSCLMMAVTPTYAKIGITASIIMISARVLQGMASTGEIVGAQLYLVETVKRPSQYVAVGITYVMTCLGGTAALLLANFVTSDAGQNNWRLAFMFGVGIAVISMGVRTKLRETPEFVDARVKLRRLQENTNVTIDVIDPVTQKPSFKTSFYYFITNCITSVTFYFVYVFCSDVLKAKFGLSPHEIIANNSIVSLVSVAVACVLTASSYYIYPLKTQKIQVIAFLLISLTYPYLLNNATSATSVFYLQVIATIFKATTVPSDSIFLSHFPTLTRFRYSAILFAFAKAIIYIINSFGLIYLNLIFGYYGILFIVLPIGALYFFAIKHFEQLEIKEGYHPSVSTQKDHIDVDMNKLSYGRQF